MANLYFKNGELIQSDRVILNQAGKLTATEISLKYGGTITNKDGLVIIDEEGNIGAVSGITLNGSYIRRQDSGIILDYLGNVHLGSNSALKDINGNVLIDQDGQTFLRAPSGANTSGGVISNRDSNPLLDYNGNYYLWNNARMVWAPAAGTPPNNFYHTIINGAGQVTRKAQVQIVNAYASNPDSIYINNNADGYITLPYNDVAQGTVVRFTNASRVASMSVYSIVMNGPIVTGVFNSVCEFLALVDYPTLASHWHLLSKTMLEPVYSKQRVNTIRRTTPNIWDPIQYTVSAGESIPCYSPASGWGWVIPISGVYQISGTASVNCPGGSGDLYFAIFVNNVYIESFARVNGGSYSTPQSFCVTLGTRFAGDLIQVRTQVLGNSSPYWSGGPDILSENNATLLRIG